MKPPFSYLTRFLAGEEGPTAVEYAMMTMLILLACLSVIVTVGQSAAGSLANSSETIERAVNEHP
jgi:pilus assembly protein Flp/PilA